MWYYELSAIDDHIYINFKTILQVYIQYQIRLIYGALVQSECHTFVILLSLAAFIFYVF